MLIFRNDSYSIFSHGLITTWYDNQVIRDGKIVQAGSYNELLQGGADLNALVNAHNEAIEFMTASVYKKEEEVAIVEALSSEVVATGDSSRVPVTRIDSMKEIMPELEKKQLVEDEETQTGRVSLSVYWNYFTSVYKGAFIPVILLAQICFQVLQIASNYWMAWSTPAAVDEAPKVDNETLILVYCAFAFGSCLFVSIRALLASTFGLLAANKSFKDMIRSVYHAPMSFFDSTPNGRILSRVSVYFASLFKRDNVKNLNVINGCIKVLFFIDIYLE